MRLAEIAGEAKLIDSDKVDGFGDVKTPAPEDRRAAGRQGVARQASRPGSGHGQAPQTLLDLAKRQALRAAARRLPDNRKGKELRMSVDPFKGWPDSPLKQGRILKQVTPDDANDLPKSFPRHCS
jgi:hypothetical protein